MPRIYAGELTMIDQEVIESLKALPDDFWVFAEFQIEHAGRNVTRNIDWFIVRQVPDGSDRRSTLILTELKRVSKALRGDINGSWEQMLDSGEWREVEPSNENDINYYWQAVNSANALADWLWNNQRRYREGPDRISRDFKLWADLLILSPPGTRHLLPLKPRYGSFWYRIDDWVSHVVSWDPERGLPLSEQELVNLAEVLGLKLIWEGQSSAPPIRFQPRGLGTPHGHTHPNPNPSLSAPQQFAAWANELTEAVHALERRVASLERELGARRDRGNYGDRSALGGERGGLDGDRLGYGADRGGFGGDRGGFTPGPRPYGDDAAGYGPGPARLGLRPAPAAERTLPQPSDPAESAEPRDSLSEVEERAIVDAVSVIRALGKSRALPGVVLEMNRILDYNLKESSYNGFGTARALFDLAEQKGLVQYGPFSGPNPTIYLPDEDVPLETSNASGF